MKIRLIKLDEVCNPRHANNIPVGHVVEGFLQQEPMIGQSFWVGNFWRTSTVTEVIDENTFCTKNSIYKIEREKL